MKTVVVGFSKMIVSYLTVLLVIMLLPVFLLTKDVAAFDSIMNYLFNNKG